ncbi:unnamed protein product [Kuraishia capsulata CBS 1993]|uniref:Carboxypeptidase n=1 Tax=Kuraishia capsulata CBS 1993 TaxID=1382522 RepID=W6MPC0_9ASCO|nr:uncharacterized protein KUCA_T00004129001 [Kuraishia capsulata CBS 1993]CDK28148.1 unnamed protein product [Kuraishia capsulata CBS 1993]
MPIDGNLYRPLALVWVIFQLIAHVCATPIDIASEFRVKDLPGLSLLPPLEQPVMHAGHLELYAENSTNYFFWKFERPPANSTIKSEKLIFWLNGGPGCSSMDGALMEIGPLRIGADGNVLFNNGSWMEAADLVFVDQPGGTGFSYTDAYDRELDEVAGDFVVFLAKYFRVFPQDLAKQVWIAGESYAGQYIPYISRAVLDENAKPEPAFGGPVALEGALIGNGWISPDHQSLSYIPFAVQENILSKTDPSMPKLLKQHEQCQKVINSRNPEIRKVESPQCDSILDVLLEVTKDNSASQDKQCINMYDYRLRDSYPSCGMNWPSDLEYVNPFLRQEKIGEYLNLKKMRVWNECDGQVSRYLRARHSIPAIDLIPDLLKEMPILLFNGDKDIICNYMGTEAMISDMKWDGKYGFEDSEDTTSADWFYRDDSAGFIKIRGNLTYTRVYGTSHMVPFDKPEVSRGLFDIMTRNYKPVTVDNSTGVATPVYGEDGSTSFDQGSGSKEADSDQTSRPSPSTSKGSGSKLAADRSWTFYAFVLTVFMIVMYGLRYLYKNLTSRPSSILSKYSKMNPDSPGRDFSREVSPSGGASVAGGLLKFNHSNPKKKSVRWLDEIQTDNQGFSPEDPENGIFGRVLNKFGYGDQAYQPVDRTDDIEMNGIDQFIIQEEDEEFDGLGRDAER